MNSFPKLVYFITNPFFYFVMGKRYNFVPTTLLSFYESKMFIPGANILQFVPNVFIV